MILRYKLTPADARQASLFHQRETWRWIHLLLLVIGCTSVLLGVIRFFHTARIDWLTFCLGLLCILYVILFPFWNHIRISFWVRRNHQLYKEESVLEFTQDKLMVRTPGTNSEIDWTSMLGFRNAPHSILLYLSRDCYILLPKRVFANAQAEEECLSLLREVGVKEV